MVCTLARASAMALPAALDFVAQVLGFENRKDPVGGALMKKYCKPASITKHADGSETYTWHDVREDYLRIGEYCLQDVEVETDADRTLLHHMPRERRVWELDQLINERGVRLDLDLRQLQLPPIDRVANMHLVPQLKALNLAFNKITRMEGFDALKQLVELNLAENGIVAMENLAALRGLQRLNL
jgi:Leucine-rich repeat (LRR) protein